MSRHESLCKYTECGEELLEVDLEALMMTAEDLPRSAPLPPLRTIQPMACPNYHVPSAVAYAIHKDVLPQLFPTPGNAMTLHSCHVMKS